MGKTMWDTLIGRKGKDVSTTVGARILADSVKAHDDSPDSMVKITINTKTHTISIR